MVDGIKARGTPPQPDLKRERVASDSPQRSTESLKQGLKSISTTLSVAEAVQAQPKDGAKKAGNKPPRITGSLEDAVRFSREALKVLEDVTAGSLDGESVKALLSEREATPSVPSPAKRQSSEPIRELASDLNALRADLKSLFESLKQNAAKSDVLSENFQAAEVETADLESVVKLAEDTSLEIQYNSKDALDAHRGITPDSVARLLSSSDSVR